MKSTLTISLDIEIINKLKQEHNYSDFVNEQLKAVFNAGWSENKKILTQNLKEIKQKNKELNKKRREIEKKIAQITEREKILRCPECGKVMIGGNCFKCGIKIERGSY
jgi:rubrerythrin